MPVKITESAPQASPVKSKCYTPQTLSPYSRKKLKTNKAGTVITAVLETIDNKFGVAQLFLLFIISSDAIINSICQALLDYNPVTWDNGIIKGGANSSRPWCNVSIYLLAYSLLFNGPRKMLDAWQTKNAVHGSKCIKIRIICLQDIDMFMTYVAEFLSNYNDNNDTTITLKIDDTFETCKQNIPQAKIMLVVNDQNEPDAVAVQGENAYDLRSVLCLSLSLSLPASLFLPL